MRVLLPPLLQRPAKAVLRTTGPRGVRAMIIYFTAISPDTEFQFLDLLNLLKEQGCGNYYNNGSPPPPLRAISYVNLHQFNLIPGALDSCLSRRILHCDGINTLRAWL